MSLLDETQVVRLWIVFGTGTAKSERAKALPWIVPSDNQLVVLVKDDGKKTMCLADVVLVAAQSMGITSLQLVEHTMQQKTEAQYYPASISCCFAVWATSTLS